MSIDESDFIKKSKGSAGVARQYCGRLGKMDNCQAGIFLSYAAEKSIGIVDSRLYFPSKDCHIPDETTFKTKKEMMFEVLSSQLFNVECIGCDASFGSDYAFLDSLPKSMYYFASVRENEYIFRDNDRACNT